MSVPDRNAKTWVPSPDANYPEFAIRLRAILKEKGLSQAKLCDSINEYAKDIDGIPKAVTKPAVNNWCTGKDKPSNADIEGQHSNMYYLCHVLDVEESAFASKSESMRIINDKLIANARKNSATLNQVMGFKGDQASLDANYQRVSAGLTYLEKVEPETITPLLASIKKSKSADKDLGNLLRSIFDLQSLCHQFLNFFLDYDPECQKQLRNALISPSSFSSVITELEKQILEEDKKADAQGGTDEQTQNIQNQILELSVKAENEINRRNCAILGQQLRIPMSLYWDDNGNPILEIYTKGQHKEKSCADDVESPRQEKKGD